MADMQANSTITFPLDPLEKLVITPDDRRRTISGILESYNSSYDALIESVQNAVDALEDAAILNLKEPYALQIVVNLKDNWFSVLDTGVGMSPDQVARAFAPSVSFKGDTNVVKRRGATGAYRGYKGVGLTFLAYATDDIRLHSKQDDQEVRGRMQYGRAWAVQERPDPAMVVEDGTASPLAKMPRGTYLKVVFSQSTRPKSLARLASQAEAWPVILRTRTAVGQILLGRSVLARIKVNLEVITSTGASQTFSVEPEFYFPHLVTRKPPFRFLNLTEYYKTHTEHASPPAEKLRQDGLYLEWTTAKIIEELTGDQRRELESDFHKFTPSLYAFVPYQASVWSEINEVISGSKNRNHLYPGLLLAVNRQRLADRFEIEPTRFETFSRNVMVIVHFDNAKPDQGRKTLQDEVTRLAKVAADRAVQYLGRQRELLKPAGDAPTPGQREVERNHDDWIFNVRTHAQRSPLHIPPVSYISPPLAEQDVVGLFHQLSAVGVFPGIRIYATSQSKTYDCLLQFDVASETPGLRYVSSTEFPLGLSPYVLGTASRFQTRLFTAEFKNNLDALIDELGTETPKSYSHINVCICWGTVSEKFDGYALTEITEANLDQRAFPGVTHLLSRDGDAHVIQVVQLRSVTDLIKVGNVILPSHQ